MLSTKDRKEERTMLQELLEQLETLPHAAFPAVNAWTNENEAVVTAEVPGIEPEKIDISVTGNTVTLRGSREHEAQVKEQGWLRRERSVGSFSRSLELPFQIDTEKVTAQARHGILTITLPRAQSDRPRRITVNAAAKEA